MVTASVLVMLDFSREFIMEIDASGSGEQFLCKEEDLLHFLAKSCHSGIKVNQFTRGS